MIHLYGQIDSKLRKYKDYENIITKTPQQQQF